MRNFRSRQKRCALNAWIPNEVLLMLGALIGAATIGQEIYLDGQMHFDTAMLGVFTVLVCGAFCELVRMTATRASYKFVNVLVWVAAAVVECVVAAMVW